MAVITSVILGAGALTLSNNPTGFNLAIIGLLTRIAVIYLPNLYGSTDLKNTRQQLIEVAKSVVGILLALNFSERKEKTLHFRSHEDVAKLKYILNNPGAYAKVKQEPKSAIKWAH